MATGAPDYYLSQANALLKRLDDIDGAVDGVITLSQLNSVQCEMLGKLTGIDTSLLVGSDLIDALDILDGTMDGVLTLSDLNISDVKTNLDTSITKLTDIISDLADALTQQTGIHDDTTAMIDYSQEDTSGSVGLGWTLISSIHNTRNLLLVENNGNQPMTISRDGGSTTDGDIAASSEATFYDSPGVWLKTYVSSQPYSAHEEWAT